MPSLTQLSLGLIAAACFITCAVCSDRMARELRHTGEARYDNPWVRPGNPWRRSASSDLSRNYRERFPDRKRIRRVSSISAILGSALLMMLMLTLPHPHTHRPEPIETSNLQLAR